MIFFTEINSYELFIEINMELLVNGMKFSANIMPILQYELFIEINMELFLYLQLISGPC